MPTRRTLLVAFAALAAAAAGQARRAGAATADAAREAALRGALLVRAGDVAPPGEDGLRAVSGAPPPPSRRRLAAAPGPKDDADRLLASLLRRGAAGNAGDLYDNRDRGHSRLRPQRHPTLTFVEYAESAQAQGLDYGLADRLRFAAPTIGNSSTALTGGPGARSQPRLALTQPERLRRISRLFAANHLYVYPEHKDHDPERGDLFPAALPQVVISQGSSGSDRPFLRALVDALAAMRPETKARLAEAGALAPALRALLLEATAGAGTPEAMLAPEAHATALDAARLDLGRMIRAAHALTPDGLPPVARLEVIEEPDATAGQGVSLFGAGLGERLVDTPELAARVARGVLGVRRYRLSARASLALGEGRPRFLWRVLRGPGATVEPQGADGAEAVATVPWTEPYPVPGRPDLLTHRVDIGVFALSPSGALSAPAVFSLAFPPGQTRRFDARGAPLEIDRRDRQGGFPRDPLLFPAYGWRDVYAYDEAGRLLGWEREQNGARRRYTRHGLRVVETDAAGRPAQAVAVRYPVERDERGVARVREVPTTARFAYRYAGPQDRLGAVEQVPATLE